MAASDDPLTWCCQACHRPVIDLDPYALDREITPFAKIGDLMAGVPIPPRWMLFARQLWIRALKKRVRRELEAQRVFEIRIGARSALDEVARG